MNQDRGIDTLLQRQGGSAISVRLLRKRTGAKEPHCPRSIRAMMMLLQPPNSCLFGATCWGSSLATNLQLATRIWRRPANHQYPPALRWFDDQISSVAWLDTSAPRVACVISPNIFSDTSPCGYYIGGCADKTLNGPACSKTCGR